MMKNEKKRNKNPGQGMHAKSTNKWWQFTDRPKIINVKTYKTY